MAGFKQLNDVFDGRLPLPGKDGKIYYVPEPDEELGLWCTALLAAGVAVNLGQEITESMPEIQLDDRDEHALYRRILGPVWDELGADGYGFATRRHFAQTAFFWIGIGEEAAQQYWNAGGDPKGSAPRAARRHPSPAPNGSMSNTGGDLTTRGPDSMNGTRRHHPRRRR
jgi:hypothetical protein